MTKVCTFRAAWRHDVGERLFVQPVILGDLVVVCTGTVARALQRVSGETLWTRQLPGEIQGLAATSAGAVAVCSGANGSLLLCLGLDGAEVWQTGDTWQVAHQSIRGAGGRLLLSGIDREVDGVSSIWLKEAATGTTVRRVPAVSYQAAVELGDNLFWIQLVLPEHHLTMAALDDDTGKPLCSGVFYALTAAGERLHLRDETHNICVQPTDDGADELWRVPGGAAEPFVADADGLVCGVRDGEFISVVGYDDDGSERWRSEPLRAFQLSLHAWQEFVVASGVLWGANLGTAVIDRSTGAVVNRELGNWHAIMGGFADDGDGFYHVDERLHFARRIVARTSMAEDLWDDRYLLAVAFQINFWFGAYANDLRSTNPAADMKLLKQELARLAAQGVEARPLVDEVPSVDALPDLSALRHLLKVIRQAGRQCCNEWNDYFSRLTCSLDFPAMQTGLPEDAPARRVQFLEMDELSGMECWASRRDIGRYPELRALSLMQNGIQEPDLNIPLDALTVLEGLRLDENELLRIPPEIAACRGLKYLGLRANPLKTIDLDRLPASLELIEISAGGLAPEELQRLEALLPDCTIRVY